MLDWIILCISLLNLALTLHARTHSLGAPLNLRKTFATLIEKRASVTSPAERAHTARVLDSLANEA